MSLFSFLLVANRGEIACRIIATAKRLGIRTIAVYSEADAKSRHVALADEAYEIGPPAASESYLNIKKIIAVARVARAKAIHPGYGFLSERAEFASACKKAGIIFVGPPAAAIRAMGAKDEAKRLMEKAGVPVVPGYHGKKQDDAFLKNEAKKIGFPVLIKAVAGGGGKGMRRVDREKDFHEALAGAQREALSAFGDARVLIEKYVQSPRHIEVQIFADGKGNAVHLFERDCSLQRRHQKVIEEAPAPGMTKVVREAMGQAAVAAARAVGYIGAGTVEFIADASKGLHADGFYFMEMNTRLQVEHPVTEAICDVDLVEWQLRIAAGEKLPLSQKKLKINGHAVEARLYAEDPGNGFLPSTGRVWHLIWPQAAEFRRAPWGLRIDTGVRANDIISPHYDPMIAKVIAHGKNRREALDRLNRGLAAIEIAGPKTNLGFLQRLLTHRNFRKGIFDTSLIDKNLAALTKMPKDTRLEGAALDALLKAGLPKRKAKAKWRSPWSAPARRELSYDIEFENESRSVKRVYGKASAHVVEANEGVFLLSNGEQFFVRWPDPLAQMADEATHGALRAPMNGKVTAVNVKEGDAVQAGDRLLIIEAMKMEHAIIAKKAGRVAKIHNQVGEQVSQGAAVIELR